MSHGYSKSKTYKSGSFHIQVSLVNTEFSHIPWNTLRPRGTMTAVLMHTAATSSEARRNDRRQTGAGRMQLAKNQRIHHYCSTQFASSFDFHLLSPPVAYISWLSLILNLNVLRFNSRVYLFDLVSCGETIHWCQRCPKCGPGAICGL